ncbi:MAG: hypothetical protein ACKVSF_05825 [Alphaproteobacteria bacterium]
MKTSLRLASGRKLAETPHHDAPSRADRGGMAGYDRKDSAMPRHSRADDAELDAVERVVRQPE